MSLNSLLNETGIRTFKTKSVLLHCDASPCTRTTVYNFQNPVVVKGGSNSYIGFAHVYVDNNRLCAEFSLLYETPERLSIETDNPLYPHLGVSITLSLPRGNVIAGGELPVQHFTIHEIILSPEWPPDSRILPLGAEAFL